MEVSGYGLSVDRLVVREGKAREQSRCSLVGREDHMVLVSLTLNQDPDTSATAAATQTTAKALDKYRHLANMWNFELGPKSWPVFNKLNFRVILAEPGTSGMNFFYVLWVQYVCM